MPDDTKASALREEIEKFIERNGLVSQHEGIDADVLLASIEMFVQHEINRERRAAVKEFIDRYNSQWMRRANTIGRDVLAAMFPASEA